MPCSGSVQAEKYLGSVIQTQSSVTSHNVWTLNILCKFQPYNNPTREARPYPIGIGRGGKDEAIGVSAVPGMVWLESSREGVGIQALTLQTTSCSFCAYTWLLTEFSFCHPHPTPQ